VLDSIVSRNRSELMNSLIGQIRGGTVLKSKVASSISFGALSKSTHPHQQTQRTLLDQPKGVEVAAWTESMPKQRREGETDSPQGQRPPGASRTGPSWTEFVRPAHQAVAAFAGAGIINRAEPRACGHSREPRRRDPELGTKGTQAPRQTQPGTAAEGRGATRLASSRTGENPPYGMIRGGGGNEGRI
jgi:hypothetical protein